MYTPSDLPGIKDGRTIPNEGLPQVPLSKSALTTLLRAVVLLLLFITGATAQNPVITLDSCHDDLDGLRKASSEADEAAGTAKSKSDDLDDCRRSPEIHDLMHDGCKSLDSDYQSALSDLEGKLDDVDKSLRSTQDSCGYRFTINRLTPLEAAQRRFEATQRRLEASQKRLCASYHGFLEMGVSRDVVLTMCKAQTDEKWCKQCLGLK